MSIPVSRTSSDRSTSGSTKSWHDRPAGPHDGAGEAQVSEQALDLRTTLAVLRRHRGLLVGAIALGAAAGVAYSMLRLPQFSSTSLVLLPPRR